MGVEGGSPPVELVAFRTNTVERTGDRVSPTTPMAEPEAPKKSPHPEFTGWRRFLNSWWMGAILGAGLVIALFGVLSAHPFSSRSVSDRISDAVGQPAQCETVGATQVGDGSVTVYRCTVGGRKHQVAECFTISAGEVRQLSGIRRLGC